MLLPFFQSSVLGLGAPLRWCLLGLRQPRCKAERKGDFKRDNANSSLSLLFSSSSSSSFLSSLPFFILLFLFSFFFLCNRLGRLPGYSCNGSTKVA